MKHIKAFAERIKNTIYGPVFYQNVVTESRGKAIGLLFWVNVVAFSILAISFLVVIIPAIIDFSKSTYVTDMYPDGLVIDIKDGVASVNQEVPYFVPATTELEIDFENVLVIDINEAVSLETVKSYNSFAVLTKDSVYVEQNENEMRVFSLSEAENLTINEENVISWTNTAEKWTYVAILPLSLMLIGMLAGLSLVYYLVVSFALALIPFFVGKIRKLDITYRGAYSISLYALVPVVLIDVVAMFFGIMSLPFILVLVLFTVVVVINLRNWKTEEVATPETPAESSLSTSTEE